VTNSLLEQFTCTCVTPRYEQLNATFLSKQI